MGYCSLRVDAQPAVEPVSVAEAQAHLRLDTTDPEVPAYITAARAWAEQYLNRTLITQTLRYTLSASQPPLSGFGTMINPIIFVQPLSWWPLSGAPINLPGGPVQSITSVTQRGRDGTMTTLSPATDYFADASSDPGRVTLRGVGQPIGSDLAISYVAGYGNAAAAVPTPIVQAIKLLLGWFYEHRGDDDAIEPTSAIKMLLFPYRLVTFA